MSEAPFGSDWVDRYIRNELGPEDEALFEERLMEDPQLQAEVEAALGIRLALRETQQGEVASVRKTRNPNQWAPWALAASVLLALTSTLVAWRGAVENDRLAREVALLRAPNTSVLTIPLDIMRSSGADAVEEKPGHGLVVLDVQVTPALGVLPSLEFELRDASGAVLQAWQSRVASNGRALVALDAGTLPVGRLELWMSDPAGLKKPDRRVIELLPPGN